MPAPVPPPAQRALAAHLKRLRLERGWRLDDAAEHLDLDVRHIQQLEAQGNPTAATLRKLVRGYGISADELFERAPAARALKGPREVDIDRDVIDLGRRLARARRTRGFTQGKLAAAAGLAVRTLRVVERGASNPNVRTVFALLRALGVTPKVLFAGESPEPSSGARVRPARRTRAAPKRR